MKMKKLLASSVLVLMTLFAFSCNDQSSYSSESKSEDFNVGYTKSGSLFSENLDYNTFGFYYNWYGDFQFDNVMHHWAHAILPSSSQGTSPGVIPGINGDIAANFYPQLGTYSSRDPQIVRQHMEMFVKSRVGVVSLSWWNESGSAEPEKISTLLNIANEYGLKVCFHIEPFGGRNASTMKTAITHLINTYGNHPAFYKLKGKPVFFIYDSYMTPSSEWATILSPSGNNTIRNTPYDSHVIGLWVENMNIESSKMLTANFDGFYTYFAADGFTYGSTTNNWNAMHTWAKQNNKLFIPSVGPGYADTRIRPWNDATTRGRNNGAYYDNMYQKALDTNAEYISITSFNEWHEGSQIEPAIAYSIPSFTYLDYGNLPTDYYLDRTAYWVNKFVEKKQKATAELFVDGRSGGYIDFGQNANYSNFGQTGKQTFTVELWAKLKYTEGFGSIISCFNEDGPTNSRKGWVINNFNNSRLRMSVGLENWQLLEPGFNYSTTNEWVHFAAVVNENGFPGEYINGQPVVIKVYKDGVLQDQMAKIASNYLPNYMLTRMIAFGHSGANGLMTSDWRLSGSIKDFHIWRSAKSQEAIQKIMNKTIDVSGFEPDLVCGWRFNSIPDNNQNIKDITGNYSAQLVGTYQWIPLN